MSRKDLKNKPLVEAILEIKWHVTETSAAGRPQMLIPARDPHYRLLLGRLFDRFQKEYPFHEQLPTATLPDEMVGQVVQHRFRVAEDDWPLVQVGPGVLTVNDTRHYTWTDFSERAREGVKRLYDAHPNVSELRIESLVLRYIDAVDFNYAEENAFDFLRDKLKVGITPLPSLFEGTGIDSRPKRFSWQATFPCSEPGGEVHIGFATGQKEEKPAILWETTVQSVGGDLPAMPGGFATWLSAAHEIADDWFFKLIEGELERRFEGV